MTIVFCENCNNEFNKTNSDILRTNHNFCCRGCAAIFNNKLHPKKQKINHYCIICKKLLTKKRKYCDDCLKNKQIDWTKITLKEVIYYSGQMDSNRYARIRDRAKRVYLSSNKPKKCYICGYDKHFEICHIKPIHLFDLSTPIATVNNINNLVALCPNCHWEFDNGLFKLIDNNGTPDWI